MRSIPARVETWSIDSQPWLVPIQLRFSDSASMRFRPLFSQDEFPIMQAASHLCSPEAVVVCSSLNKPCTVPISRRPRMSVRHPRRPASLVCTKVLRRKRCQQSHISTFSKPGHSWCQHGASDGTTFPFFRDSACLYGLHNAFVQESFEPSQESLHHSLQS